MTKSWVVVADSARARVFDSDSRTRDFIEIEDLVHSEGRAKDDKLTSDRGGRSFDRFGDGRHTMAPGVKPHELEAEFFARRVAKRLAEAHRAGSFYNLEIAAPPAFLGHLRKALKPELVAALGKVINKDLTKEKPESIAEYFWGQRKRG